MSKYIAVVPFAYVADAASLKKRLKAMRMPDGEEKEALMRDVKWACHSPDDEPFSAPCSEIEKSWRENGVVKEVDK